MKAGFTTPPVVVGGVGGSGTRVVAEMLEALGIFMGDDLNDAHDNMTLARVFGSIRDRIQALGPVGAAADPAAAAAAAAAVAATLDDFAGAMHRAYLAQHDRRAGWGWKVPGNHFILDHLAAAFPGLAYVHVIRHGIDMAFSTNQNQLRNWGRHYGIDVDGQPPERAAFAFWIAANRRAVAEAQRLGIRFLLLNFDTLCRRPAETAAPLLDLLGRSRQEVDAIVHLVAPPAALGRRAGRDLGFVGPAEQAALREFGFEPD
jgi:hypothetical protein